MTPIFKSAAGNRENQDRGCVISADCGVVLLLADGAGGVAGGTQAAAMAVELARQYMGYLAEPSGCASLLRAMDQLILEEEGAGETTCALAVVQEDRIFGCATNLIELVRYRSGRLPDDVTVILATL